jgi:glutamyl-tRNA synthetase
MGFRTRFAPSPTGRVHIGSIQKMIYAYGIAKSSDGEYIIRIEDTDRKRYKEGAEEEIYKVHEILGLDVDESPKHGGSKGPYRQSERLEMYNRFVQKLIDTGYAYYAFDTPEELEEMRSIQKAAGERPRYNGNYRDYDPVEAKKRVEAGEDHVVRLKVPKDETLKLHCEVMGDISVETNDLDDYVLMKSDGYPTYHLAVVVDDYHMDVTHVVRGVEWLPTFPIHVMLYKAFGWDLPKFVHIPNILDPDGKGKLSKRSGSVAAMDFFKKGYLPEAITNYMILLGWSPKTDREIFSLDEFVDNFNIENFNKANPTHNPDKLNWFNQQYLKEYSKDELLEIYNNWKEDFDPEIPEEYNLNELSEDQLKEALALEQERVTTLGEFPEKLANFSTYPGELDLSHRLFKKLSEEEMVEILQSYLDFISSEEYKSDISHDNWEQGVRKIISDLDLKAGQVFMTVRVGVTGKSQTPPLFEFIEVIGEEEHQRRVKKAISLLS